MTPEFKYVVSYANDEGDRSSARFTNPRSAFIWAHRLHSEGFEFKIYKTHPEGGTIEVSFAELKKEAGPLPAMKRKPRVAKQLYPTK